ncbi:hypothetical protein [Kibdelosporangium philippinense]|uniref:hypothetical protein n=1 Tax=Kibdelosporangium philippinense TaxID=211113 RepID=UPI0036082929
MKVTLAAFNAANSALTPALAAAPLWRAKGRHDVRHRAKPCAATVDTMCRNGGHGVGGAVGVG